MGLFPARIGQKYISYKTRVRDSAIDYLSRSPRLLRVSGSIITAKINAEVHKTRLIRNLVSNLSAVDSYLSSARFAHDLGQLSLEQLKDPKAVLAVIDARKDLGFYPLGYYVHGSSSASLPFVAQDGLKPKGWLMKEGKVPFIGEVGVGSICMNLDNISTTDARFARWAKSYAETGCSPWSPEISENNIRGYERQLTEYKDHFSGKYGQTLQEIRDYYKNSEDQERIADDILAELRILERINVYEQAIDIERARQKRWGELSDAEREAILYPFPVIYLIKFDGETRRADSDCHEWLICGVVPQNDMVAFVPRDKLEKARTMARGGIEVRSEEEMDGYISNVIENDNIYTRAIKQAVAKTDNS